MDPDKTTGRASADHYSTAIDRACDGNPHVPGCLAATAVPTLGPATSADLLELDAVPEPTDSDAPTAVRRPGYCCAVHGTPGFCNEITWAAPTVLGEREFPTREAVEQALRDQHIDLSEVRLETQKCGWFPDDIHARTLARARP